MAVSPVVLLNNVSEVGFGPIIEMGETPVEFVGFAIEPSQGAQVNSIETIGAGVLLQYSHDASFPQPPDGHDANWATGLIAIVPLLVFNPEQDPAPQDVVHMWISEVQNYKAGQPVVYPYMRAKLLAPLSAGTVKVEFYFR